MFDEYFEAPTEGNVAIPPHLPPIANAPNLPNLDEPMVSVSITHNAPYSGNSQSTSNEQSSHVHQGAAVDHSFEVNPSAPTNEAPFVNIFAPKTSENTETSEDQNTATSVHYRKRLNQTTFLSQNVF